MDPLAIFDKYVEDVDDALDDNAEITYTINDERPVYNIVYDADFTDKKEIEEALPEEWKQLREEKKIDIVIRPITQEDISKAKAILETPGLVELRQKIINDLEKMENKAASKAQK